MAEAASASALLIVNNEDGLMHPPGPDGKDLGEGPKLPKCYYLVGTPNSIFGLIERLNLGGFRLTCVVLL